MLLDLLVWSGIALGIILSLWGLFHQLIVGGAISLFAEVSQTEARLFVMSWVAQGAFMSFTGILISSTLFFYGIYNEVTRTVLLLTALALLLLATHVFISGFRTALRPIQIGATLEFLTGLLVFAIFLITMLN